MNVGGVLYEAQLKIVQSLVIRIDNNNHGEF